MISKLNRHIARRCIQTQFKPFLSYSTQSQVKTKRPKDSFAEKIYKLSTDLKLREQYINAYGSIRVGKIIEDLDGFAGSIAYIHSDGFNDNGRNLTIVTATCDRILMLKNMQADRDLRMRGVTTFVGRTSMEIRVNVDQKNETGVWEPILHSFFTMVALDKNTHRPTPVNKLAPISDDEKILFELGKANNKEKKEAAKQESKGYTLPSADEQALIHSLFMENAQHRKSLRAAGKDEFTKLSQEKKFVYTHSTRLETNLWMHPQFRNIHNNIYGGFLMRMAFELSYIAALNFANCSPIEFVYSDNVEFVSPVHIGDVVTFEAEVVYSNPEENLIHVRVRADAQTPSKNSGKRTTTVFRFTFRSLVDNSVHAIMPNTYREAMHYLSGRRRYLKFKEFSKKIPCLGSIEGDEGHADKMIDAVFNRLVGLNNTSK
jgi:acyl-coenzyme A thioesterase 9